MNDFFAELKRRNVYKVAVAYAVVSLLLILGFPVALILSWAFEITPEGIRRESEVGSCGSIKKQTGRKIVGLTIVAAIIASGLLAFQFSRSKSPTVARVSSDRKSTRLNSS